MKSIYSSNDMPKMDDHKQREKLIDFAFRVYSEPKVEELCLYLQNKYHANVLIVLWACWLKSESIRLDASKLDDVLIIIDTLAQLTVSRLQEIRKVVKDSSGFTRVQAKMINKHILNAELNAEKIFLQRMDDMTSSFLEDQNQHCGTKLTLDYYLNFLNISRASELAAELIRLSCKADVLSFHPHPLSNTLQ